SAVRTVSQHGFPQLDAFSTDTPFYGRGGLCMGCDADSRTHVDPADINGQDYKLQMLDEFVNDRRSDGTFENECYFIAYSPTNVTDTEDRVMLFGEYERKQEFTVYLARAESRKPENVLRLLYKLEYTIYTHVDWKKADKEGQARDPEVKPEW